MISANARIAKGAVIVGDVSIGDYSSEGSYSLSRV